MIQASILEQITIFYNILISNSALWILVAAAIGLMLLLLIASKFHNKKITKIIYATTYIGIFATLICLFHTEVIELFDYLINNIFLFLFFPNLAVYALVLIIVNIIIVKSTFSEKDNKIIKVFNIIFFVIFNTIFYLIIDNIVKNTVNVYEQLSIYTNNDLLVLIELSMKLFIVWLIILGIIKITRSLVNNLSSKVTNKNLVLEENNNSLELNNVDTLNQVLEINPNYEKIPEVEAKYNDYVDIVPMKKHKKLEENVEINASLSQENIVQNITDELDVDKLNELELQSQELVIENNNNLESLEEDTKEELVEVQDIKNEEVIVQNITDELVEEQPNELEIENQEVVMENENTLEIVETTNALEEAVETSSIENLETMTQSITNELESEQLNELELEDQEVVTKNNNIIESLEEDTNDNLVNEDTIKTNPFENIILENENTLVVSDDVKETESVQEEKKITLSSYDSIFIDYNSNLVSNIDNDMKVVFSDDDYMKNILLKVDDLKDNLNDDKIRNFYDSVKTEEDKLTLSDYNRLINILFNK